MRAGQPSLLTGGYCPTKKLYFYGVRIHIVGRRQAGTLLIPEYIGMTSASENNGKIFDSIRPVLIYEEVYGDKAYQRPDGQAIQEKKGLTVLTPV